MADLYIPDRRTVDQVLLANVKYRIPIRKGRETHQGFDIPILNIFNDAEQGILAEGNDGLIKIANYRAAQIFGYTAPEMIGMPSENLVPKRFRQERRELFRGILRDKMPRWLEGVRLHKSGKEFPVTTWIFPYKLDGTYNIAASVASAEQMNEYRFETVGFPYEDIAKEIYNALRQFALPFNKITAGHRRVSLDEAVDAIWNSPNPIFGYDGSGMFAFANPATERYFGYGIGELLGKSPDVLIPGENNAKQQRAEIIRRILETGTPREFISTPRVAKDGSEIVVPKWAGFRYFFEGEYRFGAIIYPNYSLK